MRLFKAVFLRLQREESVYEYNTLYVYLLKFRS